ncbi:helix-turn-helix transcriptional regulator [Thetidibacter halocola]|uniref:AlpA family phage regulatory protein n=1 Tax=Thetidibacter halocola TaxID=2827239 RepID=A0A8J7WGT6_9RHOB|nr:helix-turn-helix domain-containing protein [Thetidibacter halocola]MBS0126552.1 AlpA family phage regulatory protein [Thetidibacter halocola]
MSQNGYDIYLSVKQVATRLGVSADSIWRWKRNGEFPEAVKLGGRTTRWRLTDIEAWEAARSACFLMHLDIG